MTNTPASRSPVLLPSVPDRSGLRILGLRVSGFSLAGRVDSLARRMLLGLLVLVGGGLEEVGGFRVAAAQETPAADQRSPPGAAPTNNPVPDATVPDAPGADPRPNIVWILGDDISVDDFGCYEHPTIQTPHIDALAKSGLLFERAFLTCSSCSPTRCSLLTGRYPHATGAAELHQPLPPNQTIVTEPLREAGYYTVAAGKWHLGGPTKAKFDRVVEGGGPSGCEDWVRVLAERPRDKPVFAWLAAFDAHRPYGDAKTEKRYRPADAVVPPYLADTPATRADLAAYYDEITRLDGFVGDVVEELRRQEILDNTLILVMADNGRPFPRCKTTVYDSGVQTPLVVHWPQRIEPGRRAQLVSTIDLMPTCLDVAGVPVPETVQGKSLTAVLADPAAPHREAVHAEHNWHDYRAWKRAIRTDDYLYIINGSPEDTLSPPADAVKGASFQELRRLRESSSLTGSQGVYFEAPRPVEELYDVRTDPHQLHNLADDSGWADIKSALRTMLEAWQGEMGDTPLAEVDPATLTPDRFDRETGDRLPAR